MKSSKKPLSLLVLTVFAIIAYSQMVFYNQLSLIEQNTLRVEQAQRSGFREVIELQNKINKVPLSVSELAATPDEGKKTYFHARVEAQIAEIDQGYLQGGKTDAREDALYQYLKENWLGYKRLAVDAVTASQSGDDAQAEQKILNSMLYLERINNGMKMVIDFHQRNVQKETTSISAAAQSAKQNMLAVAAWAGLIFLLIGLLVARKIMLSERQMLALNEALEEKVNLRTQELMASNQELSAMNEEAVASNEALQFANHSLEEEVRQRRSMEEELKAMLESLQRMQSQLVDAEKMAALGSLVAGVAHEINTPLGNGIMAASYLEENTKRLINAFEEKKMTVKQMQEYGLDQKEGFAALLPNLERVAKLVSSFKNVAVSQMVEERCRFNLKAHLEEVLFTLRPSLKKTNLQLEVDCAEGVEIESYPGAFAQVISNLVVNALVHAFAPGEAGMLRFTVRETEENILFQFADNGRGMSEEVRQKIFEPFFTTGRTNGGTGLGLFIVYNIVTQKLGGTVECESAPGAGSRFTLRMPKRYLMKKN